MAMQERIEEKIRQGLATTFLEVINESHGHNVAPGSQTHFKVVVVCPEFQGVNAVSRHRKIYALLALELEQGVHALALHTYTPEEWQSAVAPNSPNCLGGAKR